jgi:hypothetical protein
MKFLTFGSLILFISLTFAESSQSQNIYASVDGNIVTLWETGTQRNCGAYYEMTINLNDHYMKWVQLDTGMDAYCLCVFDLSVTYGPLETGDYTVDVYYTLSFEPDEIYEGTTGFTIRGAREAEDGGIIAQYQSDCYEGLEDPESDNGDVRIYPVPLAAGELLNVVANPSVGKAILEIYTLAGKQVFSREYDGKQPIQDRFLKEELFPVSGIYIVRLTTSDQVFIKKITVL